MNILLIGGSGFVGSHLAGRLTAEGHVLLVPTRRPERARHLLPLPTTRVVQADVFDESQLEGLAREAEAIVNLVGILKGDFDRVHVRLPELIGRVARRSGVGRVVQVSALRAAVDAPSAYLRSKAAGEEALRASLPRAVVVRPSVIFGSGDSFIHLFARLQCLLPPYLPLPLACAEAMFQPVSVFDVAEVIARALTGPSAAGEEYDLCGPRRYSLRTLVRLAGEAAGCPHPVLGLSPALSWLQAAVMQLLGGPMTLDNLRSMQIDSVCDRPPPFGITPIALEAVLPTMLGWRKGP